MNIISPNGKERLKNAFDPLSAWLNDDNVVEVIVNSNGSIWADTVGDGLIDVGSIKFTDADYIVRQVADICGKVINEISPKLEVTLPFNDERFTAVKLITQAPAMTIRKKAKLFPLDYYIKTGVMAEAQYNKIVEFAESGLNIGVIGATGSGKSTLTNSILDVIAKKCPKQRMLVIEDTPELRYTSRNVEFFLTNESFDLDYCLKTAMRFRPSRITVGELRDGKTTWGLLKALNTGHNGGLFTLHADSCEDALKYRLPQLITEVISTDQTNVINKAINVLISIQRDEISNSRKIKEIVKINCNENYDANIEKVGGL